MDLAVDFFLLLPDLVDALLQCPTNYQLHLLYVLNLLYSRTLFGHFLSRPTVFSLQNGHNLVDVLSGQMRVVVLEMGE